jgi:diacylglycerol O-acyltransferase / wax synthase
MKQLSGTDVSFLNVETPSVFGHVTGLMIYDRPSPDYLPIEAVYTRYAAMLSHIGPLHRRLVEVPFELDRPYWIVDPELDLDYHIRELDVPSPGFVDQLAEQVARIIGRPLDRTRPLWEVYVIGGLQDNQWALVTKYHHASLDGAAGARLLTMLHHTTPEPTPPPEPQRLLAEPVPSSTDLLQTAFTNLQLNPYRSIEAQLDLARRMTAERQSAAPQFDSAFAALHTSPAPATPWNKSLTPHRRVAVRKASLDNIKRLKNAAGTTVNDIVLAICAGALRRYLIAHDALPETPLRAMVPVSIRTGDEGDAWTNRVSAIYIDLPTDTADPLERIARCHQAMSEAKERFKLVPADALADLTQYSAPVLAASAARLASQYRLADQYKQPYNVIISNVPGPREQLYFEGAPLRHHYPVSMVADGQGLNITVQTYRDLMDFGLVSDRALVPDLWDLADMHIDEISVLFEATGAEWAAPSDIPRPLRGPPSAVVADRARAREADAPETPRPSRKRTPSPGSKPRRSAASKAPSKAVRRSSKGNRS